MPWPERKIENPRTLSGVRSPAKGWPLFLVGFVETATKPNKKLAADGWLPQKMSGFLLASQNFGRIRPTHAVSQVTTGCLFALGTSLGSMVGQDAKINRTASKKLASDHLHCSKEFVIMNSNSALIDRTREGLFRAPLQPSPATNI